jgi:hypothetical protein
MFGPIQYLLYEELFMFNRYKQEILGRINHLRSLIGHGSHRKWDVQQFFYCCLCILCRGNVCTEPLSSNDKGLHM